MIQDAALSKVLSAMGKDFQNISTEPEVFLSRLADLAPELDKERFLMRFFLAYKGFDRLVSNRDNAKKTQNAVIQICNEMNHLYGLDKQDTAGICLACAGAVGIQLDAGQIYEAVAPAPRKADKKKDSDRQSRKPDSAASDGGSGSAKNDTVPPAVYHPLSREAETRYYQGNTAAWFGNSGIEYYRSAAEAGHPESAFAYAECLRRGEMVRRDLDEARKWYTAAAQKGHPGARLALADLYETDEDAATAERKKVYETQKSDIKNERLADALPFFNHMRDDPRTRKYAFVYLLLAFHAAATLLASSMISSVPPYEQFPYLKEFISWLNQATGRQAYHALFVGYIILTCVISLITILCCRLDKKRAIIFRALRSDSSRKVRNLMFALSVVLLLFFSLANPVMLAPWKRFGPPALLPVLNFLQSYCVELGLLNGSGYTMNILLTMSYILLPLFTCTVVIFLQAKTLRLFRRDLHRYLLQPPEDEKQHRLVRVPVLLALALAAWMLTEMRAGMEWAVPLLLVPTLLLPRQFFF